MGMGVLGYKNTIFKRKFRWAFEVTDICNGGNIPAYFVKSASRPNLDIDETEINYMHGKRFLPGKATWQTMTVTYYDIATRDQEAMWTWLASTYDFTNPTDLHMGASALDYGATATLWEYDGCGTPLDEWVLGEVWPKAINFGDLAYDDSGECTVELTLRYCNVQFIPLCPGDMEINPCCTGCTTG
jgi:hypothetical protein